MSTLSNKIDFAVILSVTKANPNGDPLNGNRRVKIMTVTEKSLTLQSNGKFGIACKIWERRFLFSRTIVELMNSKVCATVQTPIRS